MYFGVCFGLQRGFVFCRGRRNSQPMYGNPMTIPYYSPAQKLRSKRAF